MGNTKALYYSESMKNNFIARAQPASDLEIAGFDEVRQPGHRYYVALRDEATQMMVVRPDGGFTYTHQEITDEDS